MTSRQGLQHSLKKSKSSTVLTVCRKTASLIRWSSRTFLKKGFLAQNNELVAPDVDEHIGWEA